MRIGPKYKICRRIGSDIFEKCQTPKYALSEAKKGRKERGKRGKNITDYGKQLLNKQKVRLTYRVSEKQFSNYVRGAVAKKGVNSASKLYEDLEGRLDNVVYRLGLAPTRGTSRQMVSHGHIDVNGKRITIPSYAVKVGDNVNGKRITIPSYAVKVGDKIKIRERSITKSPFANLDEKMKEGNAIPAWLKFDLTKKEAVVAGKPIADTTGLDLNSIIEFYSR